MGYSLNSLSEASTNFQLRSASPPLAIAMDCSHAVFVSKEQVVVSLRSGEIYILTLVPEGIRGVKNILFEKAAAAVLPSCVSILLTTPTHPHPFTKPRVRRSVRLGRGMSSLAPG